MQFTCKTVALEGVVASTVNVQCQLSRGPSAMSIVGLPDKAVREAKERIQAAFYAQAIAIPPMKIVFNLSPADTIKVGNHYDLPMAVAILVNMELLPREEIMRYYVMGALALDGGIEPVGGVLAAAIEAESEGCGIIIPRENTNESELVPDIEQICPASLGALIAHFKGRVIDPPKLAGKAAIAQKFDTDLSQVRGHRLPRRALEIAAAGRHHMFMVGPPGSGKSLLASCLPSIMPPMTAGEVLDTTLVHSAAGLVKEQGPITRRPYFDPHHTASAAAIVGGGPGAGPGEISLAHNGVLFMDELPEFKRDVLESLRQPLESGRILIARANAHLSYPARFLLVAAANPCSCGMMDDINASCGQAPFCGFKYMSRLSGPLLDRFSLRVHVKNVDLASMRAAPPSENSDVVRARVEQARRVQYGRNGMGICNEDLNSTQLDLLINDASTKARRLLDEAVTRLSLSPRGYYRMIKTALTIADLSGHKLCEDHIAETTLYRMVEGSRANYDINKKAGGM